MKSKIKQGICLVLCLFLSTGVAGCAMQPAKEFNPFYHTITVAEDTNKEDLATMWFESLMEQQRELSVPQRHRITKYNLSDVRVFKTLQTEFVEIKFTFGCLDKDQFTRGSMEIEWNGKEFEGDWILLFREEENEGSPAGMRTYYADVMGQFGYEQMIENAMPNSYEILSGVLYVKYNGIDRIEAPLPIDKLDNYKSGHPDMNYLQSGSYVISPEKTVFMYGGVTGPLRCLYSDDAGVTWHDSLVENAPDNIEQKIISFPDGQNGFMSVGHNKRMSWLSCDIYATTDGGATWKHVRSGPGDHYADSFVFFDENLGFLSYSSSYRGIMDVCTTTDGGVNWYVVRLPMPEEFIENFTRAGVPTLSGDTLEFFVGENEHSDYSEAQDHYLHFVSTDFGETWTYDGIVRIPY